jgi:hypothetical protein
MEPLTGIEEKLDFISNQIKKASDSATLVVVKNNINLPKYILDLIFAKNKTRKNFNKSGFEKDKQNPNRLTKIQDEINAFKKDKFEKFTKKSQGFRWRK